MKRAPFTWRLRMLASLLENEGLCQDPRLTGGKLVPIDEIKENSTFLWKRPRDLTDAEVEAMIQQGYENWLKRRKDEA